MKSLKTSTPKPPYEELEQLLGRKLDPKERKGWRLHKDWDGNVQGWLGPGTTAHESASMDKTTVVEGEGTHIGRGVELGAGTVIRGKAKIVQFAVIGDDVTIDGPYLIAGRRTEIHDHCTVEYKTPAGIDPSHIPAREWPQIINSALQNNCHVSGRVLMKDSFAEKDCTIAGPHYLESKMTEVVEEAWLKEGSTVFAGATVSSSELYASEVPGFPTEVIDCDLHNFHVPYGAKLNGESLGYPPAFNQREVMEQTVHATVNAVLDSLSEMPFGLRPSAMPFSHRSRREQPPTHPGFRRCEQFRRVPSSEEIAQKPNSCRSPRR